MLSCRVRAHRIHMQFAHVVIEVRSTKSAAATWWYSLGTRGGTAVLVWPLTRVTVAATIYYTLDASATPSLMSVFDATTYEAFTLTWRGPLALQASHPKTKLTAHSVLGHPNTAPQPLLAVAAQHGFWTMSRTTIVSIARQLKIPLEDSSTLVSCLEGLYKHYHPKASGDGLATALRHRLPVATPQDEWLQYACCEDMLEQSDRADLQNCRKAAASMKPDTQTCNSKSDPIAALHEKTFQSRLLLSIDIWTGHNR
eukprot:1242572-Amphidinium_carterae.2